MTGAGEALAAPREADALPSAEALGLVAARPGVRAWAFAIDALIWLLLAAPALFGVLMISGGDLSWGPLVLSIAGLALPTIFGLVQLILHGRRGVTAGKAAMRLRSVAVVGYGRPGFWRIVGRALVLGVSGIVPLIGPGVLFASSLWDPRGRSILDKVGGCWLLDVRAGLDPADARALRRAIRELEMPLREVSEGLADLATSAQGERPVFTERRSRAGIVGIPGGPWAQPPSAVPGPSAVIADVPRTGHFLVFEDGSTVVVPSFALIGRAPEAPAGQSADLLLTLEDPQRLLSKTHLAFGEEAGRVWAIDQGSSNGTTVVSAAGVEAALAAGVRVGLEPGAVVHVGGRMFQVRQGSPTA